MLRDVVPFAELWKILRSGSRLHDPVASLIRFIEKKTGAEMVYDAARLPYRRADLADLLELAQKMQDAHVISFCGPHYNNPDEPPMREWRTVFREGSESKAGGSSVDDDRAALTAALAEATERHIWFEKTDYFIDERQARVDEILQIGDALVPARFASFSEATRRAHPHLALRDVPYTWILGKKPDGAPIYVPAQVVSAASRLRSAQHRGEPTIVYPITTGLAAWPTRDGAILRGLAEGIERDAFMVTWLNQISGTRLSLNALAAENPGFAKLLARCRRYRLEPHIVRLVTDAPTYALCAVIEDLTGHAPRFSHGLKVGSDPAKAAESALVEALRARRAARFFLWEKKPEDPDLNKDEVGHFKRLLYWAEGKRFEQLAFLHAGPIRPHNEPWQHDTEAEHLARLLKWIEEKKYGCASIAYTHSAANLTPWHIELTTIPELQPMHFNERQPYTGSKRITEVPRIMGFTPRSEPYLDAPHPFA